MANGDAALAAGMDILAGTDDRRNGWDEENKTRDYIAERTSAVTPVAKGGTGADNPEAARANLELVKWASSANADNKVPMYHGGGRIAVADPTSTGHAASRGWVETKLAGISTGVPASGGTFTGQVYFPNSTPATSGYVVAYINGDGRLSKNASSERYKKYISTVDPGSLGDIWPELSRYQMRHGDGSWKFGYIAERLHEVEDQRAFVVYATVTELDEESGEYVTRLAVDDDGNPVPDSIDFIQILMAQNAQLHQAVDLLAQRLDALEGLGDEPA